MTSPKLSPKAPGSDASKSGNRLATVSCALAFVSPAAALPGYTLLSLSAVPGVVLYLGGLLLGIVAIVVGIVALVRSRRNQPEQAGRGMAIIGLVVGIGATVLLIFPGGFLFLLRFSCAVNHTCIW